jgi:ribulose bisphosphate carboxylase small subunit
MDRSYSIGFEYIDDTAAHTGRFWQLYALADAVIASAVIEKPNRQCLHVSAA